ncbi:hypothetical protein N7E81_01195 [Reichenbachiella carrageenanivorans]|uniref:Uncharacterized protein n=1 Tax=Reichenbachiella carrageenanivorans TaxID=2979869 RepID=A0ABY6D0M4_9BACT|nr:hypothetical protein [Reichenbachiella carrageenanivorans]UXX79726.1 hypothetical protein N7E81_01195 [Reichenbachiella carrageenanivorans]
MDQLATVLEIMQNVKSLDTDQKNNVMQYVKQMSLQNQQTEDSYRKRAISEIRSALQQQSAF